MASDACCADQSDAKAKLDVASPAFDPLCALYVECLPLVEPSAKTFNNLAEFENYLKNPEKVRNKRSAVAQAAQAAPPADATANGGGKRRRQMKNVLTRMENIQGPMSFLRECVHSRLRVRVVTRNYTRIRGACRGYVVAFDKHWNLAMMDVDEEYSNPAYHVERKKEAAAMAQIKKNRRAWLKMARKAHASVPLTDESFIIGTCEPLALLAGTRTGDGASQRSEGAHRVSAADDCTGRDVISKLHGSDELSQRLSVLGTSAHADGDSIVAAITDSFGDFVIRESKLSCLPKVLHRHVNQLFIRGDNVVCVSFAGP